ncbi:MAG: hypothetical protein AAFZ74_11965 [Pseudomonadota bacterium]
MLLRRVTEHVNDQNWFAVALDFVIVVAGVFIGLQVSQWNEDAQTQRAFEQAKNRLEAERLSNLELTETFLTDVAARLERAAGAIEVLRTCEADEASMQILNDGLNQIRGTATLKLRMTALSAITQNSAFLSLMDEPEREQVKELERALIQAQNTLDFLELYPFTIHIEDSPAVTSGPLQNISATIDLQIRQIYLDTSIDEACVDDTILKPFYRWERTATFQLLRGRGVQANLNAMGVLD